MSSSAYPVIWAMKHAPVADALERLILIAMADAADADGCNSYRSKRSHMAIATGVDDSTWNRRQKAMAARGLIRRDTTPPPARYLKIPKNRRPPRWEICIPYSWWSDDQRREIQNEREDRGLPPLTPESRPDLGTAPPKKQRADKGKPNPNRRRKAVRAAEAAWGVSETSQVPEVGDVSETPPEVSSRQPRGCLEDNQPSFVHPPVEPSSSYVAPAPAAAVAPAREEEESGTEQRALALVDAATAVWVGHRRPDGRERRALGRRVAEALAEGAAPAAVHYALTRDLEPGRVRTTAVQVVMARTGAAGWADVAPPAPVPPPREVPACERHPGSARRPDGECAGCYVDRVAAS